MKKQLLLFHNAIAAYFSGNQEALDATMKQFNLKIIQNGNPIQCTCILDIPFGGVMFFFNKKKGINYQKKLIALF
jgi:hypothetical protein